MPQRAKDWLREAEAEMDAGRDLHRGKHWAWCCFTCQQAAEKALKAICEYLRIPQLGHNLNLLAEAVGSQASMPEEVRCACAHLNLYYIPTRYPNAFDRGAPADQFFEGDSRQALEDAQRVVRFAQGLITPT